MQASVKKVQEVYRLAHIVYDNARFNPAAKKKFGPIIGDMYHTYTPVGESFACILIAKESTTEVYKANLAYLCECLKALHEKVNTTYSTTDQMEAANNVLQPIIDATNCALELVSND